MFLHDIPSLVKDCQDKIADEPESDSKNETLTILCSVSKDLQSRISAKDLINALTSPIEGKGGGRVEFAQGAGKPSDREKFVSDIPNIVQSLA